MRRAAWKSNSRIAPNLERKAPSTTSSCHIGGGWGGGGGGGGGATGRHQRGHQRSSPRQSVAITLMARVISGNHLLRAHRDPIVDGDLVCIRVPHSKRPHHPPTTPLPVTQPGHMHHHDRDPEGGHAQPLLEGAPSVCPIRVRVALAKRVEKGAVPAARGDPISMQPTCNQYVISMQSVCNHRAIIQQSACHQRAISVREVGEEPFGCEEELGGGCRRVVWHAECRLRNGDSDQQVHSAFT